VKALVTGGGGFLGSFLVERLRARGDEVFVARRRDYDLTRRDDGERLFRDAAPEVVYHLAAEVGGIGANRANPGRYWFANLMMGAHVLELSREHGVAKLILAGTVCAYPKYTPTPFREQSLWDGYPEETNAPYGVAKKALLVGAAAYHEQYELDVSYLLPANLYGPRDNFDLESSHVVPALIRKMLAGDEQIVLWGDGSPTREFLYVEDAADAFVLAGRTPTGPEPINVGTGEEISIAKLAGTIAELTGFGGTIVWDEAMPNGQPRRRLDVSRARELLGFEASTPLREGLARTIAWYRHSSPLPAR
jgi:GDP-L-fucose synthase